MGKPFALDLLSNRLPAKLPSSVGLTVYMVGGLPLVLPQEARLEHRQFDAIGLAAVMAEKGHTWAAGMLLSLVQREHGVTQDGYCQAVELAHRLAGRERRAGKRAREAAVRDRAKALAKPLADVPLTAIQEDTLDRADAARRAAAVFQAAGNREASTASLAAARRYSDMALSAHSAQTDAAWMDQAMAELVAMRAPGASLAELRDGKRLRAVDGLTSLYEAETITEGQWKTGRVYCYLFEVAAPSIRSQMDLSEGRGSGGDPTAAGLQRAHAGLLLRQVDAAVLHAGELEWRVLRYVAGMRGTIRSLGDGGAAKRRHTLALQRGLNVAGGAIWRLKGLRITAR